MKKKSVMVIAGELSGDLHAAALLRAVRRRDKETVFFGIGGDELKKAGMEINVQARDMAVLGLSEVIAKYFFFRKIFHAMLALLKERRPDAVLLVDYPGFNLPFAKAARKLGFKVVYYICPQVWAWNRGRIPALAASVNRLIAIFPFEPDVFKGTGLKVDFVGHPLVSIAEAARAEPMPSLPWNGSPQAAILPGSRRQEVELILPAMLRAAVLLKQQLPAIGFIIAAASPEARGWIEQVLAEMKLSGEFPVVEGRTRQVLRQATAAWVCSGTATIETALMRCPMVVVYRVRLLTYLAGRLLIRVPFLGMVNIVAGKQVCPELLQGGATPEKLAQAIEPLLNDSAARKKMIAELDAVRDILGAPGADERAAKIILQELE
jgi:lipid-A-disaccharide synthase